MLRHPVVYVITLLTDETEPPILRGRVRDVVTDRERTFVGGEQLLRLLVDMGNRPRAEWDDEPDCE